MLQPSRVFRPGKLPIASGNVYVTRGKTEEIFKKSLHRGFIPLVYGEYGVGKTSMARHVIREIYGDENLINIESVSGKSLNDVFTRCFERSSAFCLQKNDSEKKQSPFFKKLLGFFFKKFDHTSLAEAPGPGPRFSEQDTINSISATSDSRIIEICEHYGAILVLDEIHKASDEFINEIVPFIKSYGNASCERFKIILLGTSSEATKLIHKDPGIDRLIEDIPLPPMCTEEANFVVEQGMKNLAIELVDSAKEKIISISGGYPNILQYLCLEASEFAFSRKSRKLDVCDVENALTNYVERKESRLYRVYKKAIETNGTKKYRKRILQAVAELEEDYVTTTQICLLLTDYMGQNVSASKISSLLKNLKSLKYGPILRDVERTDLDGNIVTYVAFSDPAFKSFIRIQFSRE